MTMATKGSDTLTFAYNADGLRTSKTVNGVTYQYYYADGKLIRQTDGTTTLDFFYDANGFPYIMKMGNTIYYYITNAQGDVIRVVDIHGNTAAYYKYDPYGKVTHASGTHANINPLKYRAYLHDTETGFYYLQSRYYDPEVGRFLVPDEYPTTGQGLIGNNMFSYCGNNPVAREDTSGNLWDTVFDIVSLGLSIADVCANPNDPWAWAGLVGDIIDVVIPFVGGIGEITRAAKAIDTITDGVEIAKAVDFTDEAADIVKSLDRSSGFTKSSASAGAQIHKGYKATSNFNPNFKEYNKVKGIRPDYVDWDNRIIYELKPANPRGIKSGIRQLQKYNRELGGGFKLRLELY